MQNRPGTLQSGLPPTLTEACFPAWVPEVTCKHSCVSEHPQSSPLSDSLIYLMLQSKVYVSQTLASFPPWGGKVAWVLSSAGGRWRGAQHYPQLPLCQSEAACHRRLGPAQLWPLAAQLSGPRRNTGSPGHCSSLRALAGAQQGRRAAAPWALREAGATTFQHKGQWPGCARGLHFHPELVLL